MPGNSERVDQRLRTGGFSKNFIPAPRILPGGVDVSPQGPAWSGRQPIYRGRPTGATMGPNRSGSPSGGGLQINEGYRVGARPLLTLGTGAGSFNPRAFGLNNVTRPMDLTRNAGFNQYMAQQIRSAGPGLHDQRNAAGQALRNVGRLGNFLSQGAEAQANWANFVRNNSPERLGPSGLGGSSGKSRMTMTSPQTPGGPAQRRAPTIRRSGPQ